jgi:hypothetical protein
MLTHTHPVVELARHYADGLIGSFHLAEDELREVLIGALLVFLHEGTDLAEREKHRCLRTGTPDG